MYTIRAVTVHYFGMHGHYFSSAQVLTLSEFSTILHLESTIAHLPLMYTEF